MLFSRRTIQRMLDENSAWMDRKALRAQVDALNRSERPSPLATIWEVAILNAVNKIVAIEHEPDLGAKPDIVYRLNGETVIADITAISDRTRHSRNPFEELNDEFEDRVAPLIQAGLKGGFCLSIGPRSFRSQRRENPPIELHIPPVEDFGRIIFTPAFDEFLHLLQASPGEHRVFAVNNAECNLRFTFSPKSAGWTLDKYRYTQSTILKTNPVWNALNDKCRQLKKATLPGHRGIILCDGDCDTLGDVGAWDHYGADDIIREYLQEANPIEFVLTIIPIHNGNSRDLSHANHGVISRLIHRAPEFPDWLIPIRELCARLPQIRSTASNARYDAEGRHATNQRNKGNSFRGACSVSENRIRISSRDLLELLAGTMKQESFNGLPYMARDNPFLNKLMRGQLIAAIEIEPGGLEADDDWAVIEFSERDPAVSPFRLPKRTSRLS